MIHCVLNSGRKLLCFKHQKCNFRFELISFPLSTQSGDVFLIENVKSQEISHVSVFRKISSNLKIKFSL